MEKTQRKSKSTEEFEDVTGLPGSFLKYLKNREVCNSKEIAQNLGITEKEAEDLTTYLERMGFVKRFIFITDFAKNLLEL